MATRALHEMGAIATGRTTSTGCTHGARAISRSAHRLVCLTDDAGRHPPRGRMPAPAGARARPEWERSPWRKLSVLRARARTISSGPVLFLDLDVVIVASIDCLFAHPGEFCIIENWTQRGRGIGNSSVYRFGPAPIGGVRARSAPIRPQRSSAAIPTRRPILSRSVPRADLLAGEPGAAASSTTACRPGCCAAFRPAAIPHGCQDHRVPRPAEAAGRGARRLARAAQGPASGVLDRGTLALISA